MDSPDGSNPRLTDQQLEEIIGNLLRTGVAVAATIVLLGGIGFLLEHHSDSVAYTSFRLEQSDLRSLSGTFRSATRLQPAASMWSPFVNHLNVFETIFCFNWGELCSPLCAIQLK